MATFDPKQYLGQTFNYGQGVLDPIKQQYGITDQQIKGLSGGKAGQPTPSLALGTSGYNLTMGAGGSGYTIQRAPKSPLAPSSGGGSSSSYTATSTTGGGPNAGAIGMTSSTPAGTPATGATLQSSFRNALLGQLATDPNKVSLSDPDLAPQAKAFQDAQQRSQERQQQELAEQAFAGGALGTGAYGAELGAAEQARGESEAQFNAGLLKDAKAQRLASLFEAMGMGSQQLTADEALRLQRELGLGDLNIRGQDVANDYKLGQGQLGLGLLQAMLQDRQANNQLGLDAGKFGSTMNLNSILGMIR